MIRLKGGKLASPKITMPKQESEPEQTPKRRRGRRKNEKHLLVKIDYAHYGLNTHTLGHRIQRILDGDEVFESVPLSPKPRLKKPTGPPKPTHPFFLGRAAKVSSIQSFVASEVSCYSREDALSGTSSSGFPKLSIVRSKLWNFSTTKIETKWVAGSSLAY